jgi:succinyl-CoA synthetase beta subunit
MSRSKSNSEQYIFRTFKKNNDMNLHEYQAKQILKQFNVAVPEGIIANSAKSSVDAAKKIKEKTDLETWVIKAQIHAGGRGKGGGIKVAQSLDDINIYAQEILGMKLVTPQTGEVGKIVRKVLIEQNIYYPGDNQIRELYMSIVLNRNIGRYAIVYSTQGGMDIETVAEKTPQLIYKEEIDPKIGLRAFQAGKIGFNLGMDGKILDELVQFILNLFNAFEKLDATLIEINPVVKTSDNRILAADAKIILDDNALFRHQELKELRDIYEEDADEVEAGFYGLNFVKLNGNVGCMVNGAGLAMATMDIIKLSGGNPANFLDIGGTANVNTVEAGFRIILKDHNVKVLLINIFGGIVRCDMVAQGIVDAVKNIGTVSVPVIVRLNGTKAREGKEIIQASGFSFFSATTLDEATLLVNQMICSTRG